jgi:hypothetical protein
VTTEIEGRHRTATRSWTGVAIGAGVAAVVALIIVAIVSSWSPEAWAAAAAWATAGIAGIAGAVAVGQLGEARRLRVEQAQPYVVAFMEPSGAGRFFVDLVVRNFGTTAAHDVRLTIDPAPCRRRGPWQPVWLPESIPVLVPGQEWRTFWDSGRRWELDLPDRHEAVVAFKDSQGKELAPLRSVLDWSAHKDQTNLEVFGAHHAAKALRDISKTIAKWHESGYAGLAVTAWDGDAATERRRQRLEADETESDQTPKGSA